MPADLEEERAEWRRLGWDAAATQRSWSEDVASAIVAYFERGGPMIEPATLVSVGTATVGEVPVVEVSTSIPTTPGAAQDAYVQDDAGVWWHGYGFTEPELGEPGYDDQPSRGVHRLAHLLGLRPRLRGAPRRS